MYAQYMLLFRFLQLFGEPNTQLTLIGMLQIASVTPNADPNPNRKAADYQRHTQGPATGQRLQVRQRHALRFQVSLPGLGPPGDALPVPLSSGTCPPGNVLHRIDDDARDCDDNGRDCVALMVTAVIIVVRRDCVALTFRQRK